MGHPVRASAPVSFALWATLLVAGCASRPFPVVEVSPGIFEGYKPRRQADFDTLRARGVRTIVSLQQMPWDIWPERRHALSSGFEYRNVPIMASPLEPGEEAVKRALLLLNDRSLRPVFVHCFAGKDRCTLTVGLYRIYFQDWKPEDAWAEMLGSGFHVRWTLYGLEAYFWSHTEAPEWVRSARAVSSASQAAR